MGQQFGGIAQGPRCCQQDVLAIQSSCVAEGSGLARVQDAGLNMVGGVGRDWRCLRAEDGPNLEVVGPSSDLMESLSYSPVRFDVATTIDIERSQARYSNLVVHSSRARLQRRSKVWEDWLRVAEAGRAITLLTGFPEETPRPGDEGKEALPWVCKRTPAKYFLDRALTRILIVAEDEMADKNVPTTETWNDAILVDSIQVICTATDFTLFAEQIETQLDDSERRRAILVQYMKEEPPMKAEKRRICFLELTSQDKDRFVQALTALWLEKRNDSSMWF